MQAASLVAPTGDLHMQVIRGAATHVVDPSIVHWPSIRSTADVIAHGLPRKGLPQAVNEWRTRNTRNVLRGQARLALARRLHLPHLNGSLFLTVVRGDGTVLPLGLASQRVVTTVGVEYIVDAFQNTTELENMKYHGYGTGSTAEAVGNTALVTELTTEYVTNSTRPTGTTVEGASGNIYRTVATLSPDSGTPILREHGIFSANAAGVLLDRTVFAAVTLDSGNGDSLQTTYELTLTAGN